ncbi:MULTISPECIES: DMT family transporter [Marinobacter]|jgi:drug/metabolite transporter (DMT)-like permease|uniref:EamA-like transporter family protein n=1 Tax=Marinobacter salarius TaxID=1420917 RepID=A0A1W6K9B8_9GAMM|nr:MULTISPECIES: DMT family transporter [Marinobacter]ARM84000.1 EamA-like transporter family protein [Marinobacter salarius]MBJ7299965.1 DMT family transporter [Marinobacter salarius]MCZ4285015.1 DMT family transporter [Marinobacter salarius]MDC8455709.1 DMT family transporter [Marinobacter sp. DS40M6]MDM8181933.1 DMT family transporter [Marinobacter salarius]|tara:strand:+ start:749 stop:1705 length:957 start_codon:yes stop_codon:yes gene_type:complete
MPLSNTHKSDLLLVVVTLMAAISWIFSKEAVLLMPPLMFMALRFLLAGSVLAVIAWPSLKRLSLDQFKRSAGVGLVFGVAMSFWVMGLFHVTHIGEGAFLTSLGVVIVPVIARVIFQEAQPLSTWFAIPVAVGGLALLSLKNGFRPEIGQVFFVVAAFIFALYFTLNTRAANQRTVINRRGESVEKHRVPALPLTTIALLTVGTVTLTESVLLEPWTPTLENFSGILAGWVIASAVVGTAGRFLLQTYAQSLATHSHGVVILVLEPVWVALFAAGWFSESMSTTQLAGCGLIFLALLINRWGVLSKAIKGWARKQKTA